MRPDAHFAQPDPQPVSWGINRVAAWNAAADTIKQRCGAFSDRHHAAVPSSYELNTVLERIWNSGQPDAAAHMPELDRITEAQFGEQLVAIAGTALRR